MPFPQRLIEGHRAFLGAGLRREQDRYRELAQSGQSPEIMVIGCCDSRVSPEVIFDARPGELFVVRNVANIVPPYAPDGQAHGVSAALEFGVAALKVKHIVVLGHAHCGGVKAFAEKAAPLSPGDFIGNWMRLMAPAAETVGPQRATLLAGLSHAARAGERRQQPEQSAHLPAAADVDRARGHCDPRRLFRRRHRTAFAARCSFGGVPPDRFKSCARGRDGWRARSAMNLWTSRRRDARYLAA